MIPDETLNIVILLLNVLLGGLCFGVARGERPAPALRYWGSGLCIYTLGILVVMSSGLLPAPLANFGGNALITLAPLISVRALFWHSGTPFDPRWTLLALPAIAVLAWNNFLGEFQPLINFVAPTLVAIIAFVYAALRLLAHLPPELRATVRLVAIVSLVAAALWTVRVLLLTQLIPIGSSHSASKITVALAIGHLMATVAGTFALLAVEVRSMEHQLRSQARRDALTGLPNRWAVEERFAHELDRAARQRLPFGLLLLDIDHFKPINDVHGHLAGDAMLRRIATALVASKRSEDLLARVGGEEFLLLFVGADGDAAQVLGKRLTDAVQDLKFDFEGHQLSVTISGGMALFPDDGIHWQALYAVADQRLYRAKHRGRNQVCGPWNAASLPDASLAGVPAGSDGQT